MMRVTAFKDKTVAVFGLGASGTATAEALIAGGAKVAAWDDGEPGRAAASKAGVPLVDLQTADWAQFAALVLAPGVPLTHPEPHWTVKKAQAAGVEVIGDVELLFRERALSCPDAPVVAITGHQRQIDDDGAHCAHPARARLRRADGRQHRPGGADAGASRLRIGFMCWS